LQVVSEHFHFSTSSATAELSGGFSLVASFVLPPLFGATPVLQSIVVLQLP
jgi:hypothetical protein